MCKSPEDGSKQTISYAWVGVGRVGVTWFSFISIINIVHHSILYKHKDPVNILAFTKIFAVDNYFNKKKLTSDHAAAR